MPRLIALVHDLLDRHRQWPDLYLLANASQWRRQAQGSKEESCCSSDLLPWRSRDQGCPMFVRHPSWLYLCWPQLLPVSQGSTPLQQLWASCCNHAYIFHIGFWREDIWFHPQTRFCPSMVQHSHLSNQHKICWLVQPIQLLFGCQRGLGPSSPLSKIYNVWSEPTANFHTHPIYHLMLSLFRPENAGRTAQSHLWSPHQVAEEPVYHT